MWRKLWPALAIVVLASCSRRGGSDANAPMAKVRGEPIEATVATEPTNTPPRNKHPKPASTQRRMVMAELVQATQTDAWNGALPSGTRGTAADLAKTNLTAVSNLPVLNANLPGYQQVSFNELAGFDFALTREMSDGSASSAVVKTKTEAQIPAAVRALDGTKVVIDGFLLPVRMNNGLAVEFLLMRNQSMCCYGVPPKITEWITVAVKDTGVKPVMDQPIAVAGVLHVGAINENGCLAGIYRLDGEKVITPF
jgi:hypothetical protein